MTSTHKRILGALALLLLAWTGTGWAHKVNLFAYVEGGRVHVEGYFVDGSPSRDSRVVAYAADGTLIAEGVTDDQGQFSFPAPPPQPLRLVMEASMGHRNEITLAAAEFGAGGSPAGSTPALDERPAAPPAAIAPPQPDPEVLDQLLARRLRPLQEALLRIQQAEERPGIAEILGGIGYILGLAGAYLWGASRRRTGE